MTNYSALSVDELYKWISSLDGEHFKSVTSMRQHFDVLITVAGLLLWRAKNNDHYFFKKRSDDKVTITPIDSSGERLSEFSTWCTVTLAWLEANVDMSRVPSFDPLDFRDELKSFIEENYYDETEYDEDNYEAEDIPA